MYSVNYFFHIAGLAIWIGSLISLGILLVLMKKNTMLESDKKMIQLIVKLTNWAIHPSAFVVIVSGVYMLIQMNLENKPFYILFMERFGSLVLLLSIILLSVQSRRIKQKLLGKKVRKEFSLNQAVSRYSKFMVSTACIGLIVLLIVSMKM